MALKHFLMKLRDNLRFKWAKSKFDFHPSGQPDKFSFSSCHHVVILKLDGKLGDTQVMTHFYAALRAHNPRIFLSVVCTESLAEIYRDILHFDQVLVSSRKPKADEIRNLCQQIKAVSPVSAVGSMAGRIDLVVTTEPNFRPRDFIFNFELEPRYVAGCETRVDCVNLLIYDPSQETAKVSSCFADLMDAGGLAYGKIAYTPLVTKLSLEKMGKWLHLQHGDKTSDLVAANEIEDLNPRQKRFLLAINPRASSRSRSFTDEFTVKLMQDLQLRFGAAHALGYPQEEDSASSSLARPETKQYQSENDNISDQITDNDSAFANAPNVKQHSLTEPDELTKLDENMNEAQLMPFERDLEFVMLLPPNAHELKERLKAEAINCGASVFFLPEQSTALDLASAIDLCDALISVDTAAVHMACASHCPQLCVYTGNNLNEYQRWAPLDPEAKVIRKEGVSVPDLPEDMLLKQASEFVQAHLQMFDRR